MYGATRTKNGEKTIIDKVFQVLEDERWVWTEHDRGSWSAGACRKGPRRRAVGSLGTGGSRGHSKREWGLGLKTEGLVESLDREKFNSPSPPSFLQTQEYSPSLLPTCERVELYALEKSARETLDWGTACAAKDNMTLSWRRGSGKSVHWRGIPACPLPAPTWDQAGGMDWRILWKKGAASERPLQLLAFDNPSEQKLGSTPASVTLSGPQPWLCSQSFHRLFIASTFFFTFYLYF